MMRSGKPYVQQSWHEASTLRRAGRDRSGRCVPPPDRIAAASRAMATARGAGRSSERVGGADEAREELLFCANRRVEAEVAERERDLGIARRRRRGEGLGEGE